MFSGHLSVGLILLDSVALELLVELGLGIAAELWWLHDPLAKSFLSFLENAEHVVIVILNLFKYFLPTSVPLFNVWHSDRNCGQGKEMG